MDILFTVLLEYKKKFDAVTHRRLVMKLDSQARLS